MVFENLLLSNSASGLVGSFETAGETIGLSLSIGRTAFTGIYSGLSKSIPGLDLILLLIIVVYVIESIYKLKSSGESFFIRFLKTLLIWSIGSYILFGSPAFAITIALFIFVGIYLLKLVFHIGKTIDFKVGSLTSNIFDSNNVGSAIQSFAEKKINNDTISTETHQKTDILYSIAQSFQQELQSNPNSQQLQNLKIQLDNQLTQTLENIDKQIGSHSEIRNNLADISINLDKSLEDLDKTKKEYILANVSKDSIYLSKIEEIIAQLNQANTSLSNKSTEISSIINQMVSTEKKLKELIQKLSQTTNYNDYNIGVISLINMEQDMGVFMGPGTAVSESAANLTEQIANFTGATDPVLVQAFEEDKQKYLQSLIQQWDAQASQDPTNKGSLTEGGPRSENNFIGWITKQLNKDTKSIQKMSSFFKIEGQVEQLWANTRTAQAYLNQQQQFPAAA
jgi:hypothetical protein